MLGNLKPLETILILLLVVVLFGAKKLPDLARSLGKSARILKSEAEAMRSEEVSTARSAAREQPAAHVIQSAPGDPTGAHPVREPVDRTTVRS